MNDSSLSANNSGPISLTAESNPHFPWLNTIITCFKLYRKLQKQERTYTFSGPPWRCRWGLRRRCPQAASWADGSGCGVGMVWSSPSPIPSCRQKPNRSRLRLPWSLAALFTARDGCWMVEGRRLEGGEGRGTEQQLIKWIGILH